MSDNAYGSGLARRIREWDDHVEDHDREQAVKPFDGGIMLSLAVLFERWDELDARFIENMDGRLVQAVRSLRDTVEQVIE